MNINWVLKEELKLISLSKEEQENLDKTAEEIINKLESLGIHAEIGGSLAKGTIIKKKTQDIDIFVIFNEEKEIEKLENILDKINEDIKKIHGSRDYFQIIKAGLILELIPVTKFDEPSEAKNITDFSLLHVKYIKNKLAKNKKLANEIKLAKTFCYAQNCYGAESYIKGFSGYALELLIIHFGSFQKMLKSLTKNKTQIIIDIEKKFKGNALKELNESKLISPIILIDPTYKFRNATAGLSQNTLDRLKKSASAFLKKPSLDFFKQKEINPEEIKKQAKKSNSVFIEINLKTEKQEGDIAATKMKKFFDFITSNLERKQQKISKSEFVYKSGQEAKAYLIIKEKKEAEAIGPPIKIKPAVQAFKRVHKKTFIKSGKICSKIKLNLKEILESFHRFEEEMNVKFEVVESN